MGASLPHYFGGSLPTLENVMHGVLIGEMGEQVMGTHRCLIKPSCFPIGLLNFLSLVMGCLLKYSIYHCNVILS